MFPALRLPILPLFKIISKMDQDEMFKLYLTSKRMGRTVRAAVLKKHNGMEIIAADQLQMFVGTLEIETRNAAEESEGTLVKIGEEDVLLSFQEEKAIFYLEKPKGAICPISHREVHMKNLINFFAIFFKLDEASAVFNNGVQDQFLLDVMTDLKGLFIALDTVQINLAELTGETLKFILEQCDNISLLKIHNTKEDGFNDLTVGHVKVDKVNVSGNIGWIHLKSFMNCKSVSLSTPGAFLKMTVHQLNEFFRNWIISDSCLVFLRFPFQHANEFQELVQGLSNKPIVDDGRSLSIEVEHNGRALVIRYERSFVAMRPKSVELY